MGGHGRLQTGRVGVGPKRAEVQWEDVRVERGKDERRHYRRQAHSKGVTSLVAMAMKVRYTLAFIP